MHFLGCFVLLLAFAPFATAIELDQSPPEPGDWGFRPADGTVEAVNPPGFSWRPVQHAAGYVLQIARDDAFDNIVYEETQLPWSSHCPDKALEAGRQYHWRYAALGDEGEQSAWSSVRAFSIAGDAVLFPRPTTESLIKRIPEEHPRLFFRPEDLPRFRDLATGTLQDAAQNVIQQADKLLENLPDTTEPPKYPEGMERKSGEWRDMWWGNRLRTIAVTDGAATLAFAYRLTGDERYGKAARDLLMAFIGWDPKGSTQYDYNDEAGMPALYFPSRAYTWVYPMLSEDDRAKVVEVMAVRGKDCFDHLRRRNHLWRPYASHSNRAWHFLGEVAIAFNDTIPDAPTWLDYATTIFYTAYPVWSDTDGGWHEGTAYWVSYLNRFMYWALNMHAIFGVDVFERPFFKQTGYFGMYLMPPGTQTGGFADGGPFLNSSRIASFMSVMAAGANNPHWKWYAEQHDADPGGGYLGFLYRTWTRDVSAQSPADLPSSKAFYGVGIAALNSNLLDGTDNTQILFKSSPFGRQSHGHNANNAFVLNIDGRRVLQTTGRRDVHGSPHHTQYMWNSKSDNAILVAGQPQIPHSAESVGEITRFETNERYDILEGEASSSYENLDRWTRRIIFFKPDVFVIHDILEAPEPTTFQYSLHADRNFGIRRDSALWTDGVDKVDIKFLAPDEITLYQHNKYDPPPAEWANFELDEWHLIADNPIKVARREFVALYTINDAKAEAELTGEDGARRLRLQLDNGVAQITLADDNVSVQWE